MAEHPIEKVTLWICPGCKAENFNDWDGVVDTDEDPPCNAPRTPVTFVRADDVDEFLIAVATSEEWQSKEANTKAEADIHEYAARVLLLAATSLKGDQDA